MSMIENVARALYEHWVEEDFGQEYCCWDLLGDKQTWLERAQVAVAAMRDPTVAMVEAGAKKLYEGYEEATPDDADRIFACELHEALGVQEDMRQWITPSFLAMIDAAIREGEKL